ncbi:MAG: c-type cytochrome [Longimicrobiales bacterium]|nr:c-type cytochrome [Longimicrobiales bacterium]
MWQTNLKVLSVVLVTVALYTGVANWIPQVESAPPEELSFTGDVSAEELVAAGEELFLGAGGCAACHGSGTRAPNLRTSEDDLGTIGERCDDRVSGEDCKTYLHESLVNPTAYVVEGYGAIMPDASRTLSPAQIWSLVAYLQSLGGEVTVTGADIQAEPGAGGAEAGEAAAASPLIAGGSTDPMEILEAGTCLACHALDGQGGPIGPPLDGIGARRDAAHIRRSILDPSADTTEGYENVAGTMPPNFGQQMSAAQLEAVVRFLAEEEGG